MKVKDYHLRLLELYNSLYNEVLKPLLATVEAVYECHPPEILNEIRAFNDHIARCYRLETSEEEIKSNLDKAKNHLKRAMYDCFKHLNVYYFDKVKGFDRTFRDVDLTVVNNGNFYSKYIIYKKEAVKTVREAKVLETFDFEQSFDKYQEAYEAYAKLMNYIEENIEGITWAKKRFTLRRIVKIVVWFITIIATVILTSVCTPISDCVRVFLKQCFSNYLIP